LKFNINKRRFTMKNLTATLLLFALPFFSMAQQTIDYTITHDGMERFYILYVPASYTGDEPVPLIFNFHAFGGFAQQQMAYGDFRPVADTAGFIVAHPQGAAGSDTARIWNIGEDTTVADDIGFTAAMIDSISAEYNINLDRVYATGHSMGAFFSIHLAGHLSDKIAAIASVCGSMTQYMYDSSNPVHQIPYMEIHGTADPLVPYNGANPLYLPVPEVIDYWVDYNNCNTAPIITELPDIDPDDGSTVEYHVYEDGNNGVHVEHFKVIGGGHTWPGPPGGNRDIDASAEIWNFFSKYDINGSIGGSSGIETIEGNQTPEYNIRAYPNPFVDKIYVEGVEGDEIFTLSNIMGHVIYRGENISAVEVNHLVPGIYFLEVRTNTGRQTVKLIKR
jgi:polyhydroxybutyrate depolymerase